MLEQRHLNEDKIEIGAYNDESDNELSAIQKRSKEGSTVDSGKKRRNDERTQNSIGDDTINAIKTELNSPQTIMNSRNCDIYEPTGPISRTTVREASKHRRKHKKATYLTMFKVRGVKHYM